LTAVVQQTKDRAMCLRQVCKKGRRTGGSKILKGGMTLTLPETAMILAPQITGRKGEGKTHYKPSRMVKKRKGVIQEYGLPLAGQLRQG